MKALDVIESKSYCSSKDPINRAKMQVLDRDKIFAIHAFNKRVVERTTNQ